MIIWVYYYRSIMCFIFLRFDLLICNLLFIIDFPDSDNDDPTTKVFKESCLQFFVNVVIEFCFSDKAFKRIDKEFVLPRIMSYAFSTSAGSTKRFSPIEEYAIDESPVIRSFILQQFLAR